jgi:HEAT repeat protein
MLMRLSFIAMCFGCASICERPSALMAAAQPGDPSEALACLDAEESWIREESARALAPLRSDRVIENLEKKLLDRNERPWVRAAAADGLATIARASSFDVMTGVIVEPGLDPEAKVALIEGLCAFPEKQADAVQAIAPLADDEDIVVSALAAKKVSTQCAR